MTSTPSPASPTLPSLPAPQLLPSPRDLSDAFSDLPDQGRAASRSGDPRSPAYWAVWNTCAEDNRAETAAANGGRAAGFFLMDDLLADPGLQLGDFSVESCGQGLGLLQGLTIVGETTTDPLYRLASALLAAELNLGVGAETCPIAEEAVIGGHLLLSQAGFNGQGSYQLSAELANAVPRLQELLEGYNRGELCR